MKPFHVLLTDEQRERLELHRQALGLRSGADVLRRWIEAYTPERPKEPA